MRRRHNECSFKIARAFEEAFLGLNFPTNQKKRPLPETPFLIPKPTPSAAVIHLKLHRMRRHFEAHHFRHLQLDERVDEIVIEHAAGFQEGPVLVQIRQSLAQ